ncbi:MAG TPA: glycosyltransferase family 4 protein [Ktedonobacteraceae bacterium]|jgi:glycosyltransferase involved in cell wall biosynthesis|nr:glycosyltransferase family 4 protein [Ktedonobacteraceae bacterium]
MKIAHIAPPWIAIPPKNYGGTENVIYNLVEAQVAQEHDVTLFAPGDARTSARHIAFFPKSLLEEGVPWQAHLQAYYHLHKAVAYVKEHEFDIVHTHLSSAPDMYIFPLTAPLSTPHVTTLHSRFPFDRMQSWTGQADEYYMEWAPSVPMVAISESARAEVPFPLNFVGVVHHGLLMKQYVPAQKKRGDFFVWLGRFVADKGTHLAIEAAKRAGVKIVLAGTIDRHQHESVNYFNYVIKPLIDNEQVKYIGPVNMKEKVSLLSRARGFLNPIEWEEPFGMVMIEAMALGCPVISFARGAAPEIIVHRKTGFLVHDVDEMVRFIPRVDEIDREAIRMYVERNFSARVMAEKYVKIYDQVIKQAKGVPVRPYLNVALSQPQLTLETVPTIVRKVSLAQVARPVQAEGEAKPGL